jgi:hypothetical protein
MCDSVSKVQEQLGQLGWVLSCSNKHAVALAAWFGLYKCAGLARWHLKDRVGSVVVVNW